MYDPYSPEGQEQARKLIAWKKRLANLRRHEHNGVLEVFITLAAITLAVATAVLFLK